jgi:AbrB family looped-hinge helix DNA binding protein
MMPIARTVINSRNRLVLPKEVRKRLGLRLGSIVEFEVLADYVIVRSAKTPLSDAQPLRQARMRKPRST